MSVHSVRVLMNKIIIILETPIQNIAVSSVRNIAQRNDHSQNV
jgi:hypothetical protein